MRSEAIIANPLGWAQVRLLGGWRRIGAITGLYAAAVVLFHVFIYRMMGTATSLSMFAGSALQVMTFIEALIIFFVGAGAIKKAIQRDFTTEMIASHRMTAMSGYSAVIGYMTGATAQVLMLTLVNWVTCTILAGLAGISTTILAPTLILVVFGTMASMFWTLAVLVGLGTRGTTSVAGVLVLLVIVWNAKVVIAVPGLALLVGFTAIQDLPTATAGGITDASFVVSMFAQMTFALAFFIAAARKFGGDEVPAFTPVLAYALFAAWTLLSAVALTHWPDAAGSRLSRVIGLEAKCVATMVGLALVAFLPVAAVALREAQRARRSSRDADYHERRPYPFYVAPMWVTIIACVILFAVKAPIFYTSVTAASPSVPVLGASLSLIGMMSAFLLSMVSISGLLRFTYSVKVRGIIVLVAYVVLGWAVPPLLDMSLALAEGRSPGEAATWLFGCSPVGTWIITLTHGVVGPLLPGLAVQAAVAAVALALAARSRD